MTSDDAARAAQHTYALCADTIRREIEVAICDLQDQGGPRIFGEHIIRRLTPILTKFEQLSQPEDNNARPT
jgi:hypothetical protein